MDKILTAITEAAAKREAIATARRPELAAAVQDYIKAGRDGKKLAEAQRAAADIDPAYPLTTAAFRAEAVKDLRNTGAVLKKATAAQDKAQNNLDKLHRELTEVQAKYAQKIADASEALEDATFAVGDARTDDDRYRALAGEYVESQAAYSDPVLREWAVLAGVVKP